MERTLILFKPDAVHRGLIGRILARFEAKGLKIVALKMLRISPDQAGRMYAEHKGEDFYAPLVEFVTGGPTVAMVLEAVGAVGMARSLIGPTFGPDAPPGTIRGDLGASRRYNLVHGSDSAGSAEREIPLFFRPEELMEYDAVTSVWVYARHLGKLI